MKILLVGIDEIPHLGRSFHNALRHLGHNVEVCDDRQASNSLDRGIPGAVIRRLWKRDHPFGASAFNQTLLRQAANFRPEVILAVKGGFIDPETLRELRRTGAKLLNYSTDDPFNPVVSTRWLMEGLPLWDVYATPRRSTIDQLRSYCNGMVTHVRFGYDPDLHFPQEATAEEARQFKSDLAFVGTCDRNRIPLLEGLTRIPGVNVGLYGDGYYRKSHTLRASYRGIALDQSYRLALGQSKIGLTLVRHTNRDHHTLRTFEVPACGAFMLAERTDEHSELFDEDREAAFFSTEEELVDKIRFYLANATVRDRVALAGRQRVLAGRHTYQDRLKDLFASMFSENSALAVGAAHGMHS